MTDYDESANGLKTYFAPAERAAPKRLSEQLEILADNPVFDALKDSIDGFLMILNSQRQLLAVNRQLLDFLGLKNLGGLIGKRPGEALGCIFAESAPGGCGTGRECSNCGAVLTILVSQKSEKPVMGECLATFACDDGAESAEFRVRATPRVCGNEKFTILVMNDVSGDKRREALERAFFHDIMNSIGGLLGWARILKDGRAGDLEEASDNIHDLARRIYREVESHRLISQAESGALETRLETETVEKLFRALQNIFSAHPLTKDRILSFESGSEDSRLLTDKVLLLRVLCNMIKNALEATPPGGEARVSFDEKRGFPAFRVHNPGCIPEKIRSQIFKRSFSTKEGRGRGIGTYSMKLFGERFLKGAVGFDSSKEKGTTFYILLPDYSKREPAEDDS